MNTVNLIGNLGTDVTIRYLPDGTPVASFLLVVDRPGSEKNDAFRVSAWNGVGEACAAHIGKGREVAVVGSLRSSEFNNAAGVKTHSVEVSARSVTFLRGKKQDTAPDQPSETLTATTPEPAEIVVAAGDDIPFSLED